MLSARWLSDELVSGMRDIQRSPHSCNRSCKMESLEIAGIVKEIPCKVNALHGILRYSIYGA